MARTFKDKIRREKWDRQKTDENYDKQKKKFKEYEQSKWKRAREKRGDA